MGETYRYGFGEPYQLEPAALYATLRREAPTARITTPYGMEGWLVTRHHSVQTVFSHPAFSRAAAEAECDRLPRSGPLPLTANPLSAVDPPEHTHRRHLVAGAFAKREAKRYRPRAQQIAHELIDDIVAAGSPTDISETFAKRLPTLLIGEIFGVPESDRFQFRDWAVPVLSRTGHTEQELVVAERRFSDYLTNLLVQDGEQPAGSLAAAMWAGAREHQITDQQIIALISSFLLNDSIANQITSSLCFLLTRPAQLRWLAAHLSRMPQAVEELLRFVPLAPDVPGGADGHVRMAVQDVVLDGVTIRAGDFVVPSITSANRDERVFPHAHEADLGRTRNPHLTFGYGTHRCPGAELSRMELQVALSTIITRLPELRLAVPAGEVRWKVGMLSRGPASLPVQWG
jgi:nocardicin N-oxygenase